MSRSSTTALLVVLSACGGTAPATSTGDTSATSERGPLDVELRHATGEALELADYRGQLVLLYLFATFDLPSQAALEPLREVATQHPDLRVVGIALQPNAAELLKIFGSALGIEFPLAYDPANVLLRGLTDVGQVEGVPAYVLLDRHGVVARKSVGPMGAAALRSWCGFE